MKKILQKMFGSKLTCSNCVRVHELLNVIIDDEASKEEEQFFKGHIDECAPCLEKYNVERSLIDKIKSKLSHKCCPENVVNSIKEQIKSIQS